MPYPDASHFSIDYWKMPTSEEFPLYPYCVEEIVRKSPVRYQSNGDTFFMLIQILSGNLHYRFRDTECVLSAGDAMFVASETPYEFESFSCGGCYHKLNVEFRGTGIKELPGILRLPLMRVLPGRVAHLTSATEAIRLMIRENNQETIPALLGKAYELLTLAVRNHEPGGEEPELLQKAKSLLVRDFRTPRSVADIAEELRTGTVQLGRLFRRYEGCSPLEFRIRRKMEEAEQLLRTTPLSIKEVSYLLGYCNQYHFANEFKRLTGVSPTAFRKQ